MGVDARVVEHQVRGDAVQGIGQPVGNGSEIVVIAGAVGEGDVDIPVHFAQGEIAGGVHREGGHPGVVLKAGCRTIPLVHIEIHDQNSPHLPCSQQHPSGDSTVVEDAEATPEAGVGVVGAARQMRGQAPLESQSCRQQGAAHGKPGALHQRPRGRKPDATLLRSGQVITAEGFVIFAGMDALQISAGDAQGPMHLVGLNDPLLQQELMQQPELRHRKAMGARQRRGVMRVVNDRKRQGVVSPGMAQPHSRVRQAVGAATSR